MATNDRHADKDGNAVVDAEIVDAVRRYESMAPEEIDAELKQYGIDAAPTIAKVSELVRAGLAALHTAKRSAR